MKHLLLLFFIGVTAHLSAQRDYSTIVTEINKLFVATDKPETVVIYNNQTKLLMINAVEIPVTQDVIIRYSSVKERHHKFYYAEFYFQKGLAVTSRTDPQFKRAYYALSLPDKESAQAFIKLYNELYNLSI